jgi:FKBP-type peptidyl-prolyl cis-trans isomerase
MSKLWLWRGLLAGALPVALVMAGCAEKKVEPPPQTPPVSPPTTTKEQPKVESGNPVEAARKLGTATDKPVVKTASGLQYIDVKEGTGEPAKAGDMVNVHYTGWLVDGTKFDSSVDRGKPFSFPLGGGRVIRGWDEGVAGMKPGGVRKLVLTPDLGYGASGTPGGPIPPNATLIFEVQYLGK